MSIRANTIAPIGIGGKLQINETNIKEFVNTELNEFFCFNYQFLKRTLTIILEDHFLNFRASTNSMFAVLGQTRRPNSFLDLDPC